MLSTAARTADYATPRLDAFYDPLMLPFGAKPNNVASRNDMPLIGRERFEQSAGCALKKRAHFVAHDADQTLNTEHASDAAHRGIDIGQHPSAGIFFDDFSTSDGSLTRDCALPADSFT
jgi:hypothetical protein